MTENKDLKRLVRARMKKTGEAYTAARAQVIRKPKAKTRTLAPPAPAASSSVNPKDYAELAGMSDAVIKEKTGCKWEAWVNRSQNYPARQPLGRASRDLDTAGTKHHPICGVNPRPTSRDSAPAGVLCEAKGGTLPDRYRRPFASPWRTAGE